MTQIRAQNVQMRFTPREIKASRAKKKQDFQIIFRKYLKLRHQFVQWLYLTNHSLLTKQCQSFTEFALIILKRVFWPWHYPAGRRIVTWLKLEDDKDNWWRSSAVVLHRRTLFILNIISVSIFKIFSDKSVSEVIDGSQERYLNIQRHFVLFMADDGCFLIWIIIIKMVGFVWYDNVTVVLELNFNRVSEFSFKHLFQLLLCCSWWSIIARFNS